MAKTIALLGCTKTKRQSPSRPGNLYDPSTLYCLRREYANRHADEYYILSAKHGCLDPDGSRIEPYDETLITKSTEESKRWAVGVYRDLQRRGILAETDHVIFLAGSDYYAYLRQLLDSDVQRVEIPTEGLGLGETLSYLSED